MTTNKTLLALTVLGSILLASGQRPALAADLVTGTPVQTIHSKFGDPQIDPATNPYWFKNDPINYDSPDGSDIVYLGTNPSTAPTAGVSYRNTLLLCDGEVDEMTAASWAKQSSPSGFSGFNLFEMSMTGTLLNTFSTTNSTRTGWSNEPVGCSFNPHNGHLFISDDDQRLVFEINPGSDGELFTADDSRTSFSTSVFGNNDPEGLAYNPVDGALYMANGVDSEIHKILPGANGRFDGVPPAGDDVATHFDVLSQGVTDPEGIAFDADNRLYVVGKPQTRIAHIYTSGPLVRTVDISAFNYPFGPRKPAGLAVGPSGTVFISARGLDNNADPNENDGQVHEVSVPELGAPPPAVAAGPDLTVFMPNNAQLQGASVNTGNTTWSQVSGPGTAAFENPDAAVTTASFSIEGIYVLRLSDNSSTTYDEATIQVRLPTNGFGTIYASPLLSTKVPINPDNPNSVKMSAANEDIIAYNTVTRTWSLLFDGSKVGLGATGVNVDAFKVMEDGSILLSLDVPVTLPISDPSVGSVVDTLIDDSDIVRFVPTAMGANTAGSFQWFFDGSDVGLDTDSEDIDSIGFLPSGKLVVSLTGSGAVPGISTVQDEDLIAFTASDLGLDTGGTWNMHFDGSDVGLSDGGDGEDVMGAWFDSNNAANSDSSNIYLSTKGDFSVPGATGDGADILKCTPSSVGTATACSYAFTWDGGGNGISVGVVLDGIDLVPSQPDSDTTPPTVSLTAPADNTTVSGTITVSADAADNVGVAGVQFQIDGNPLGVEITGSGPYEFAWDTSVSGVYSLTAVARDAAGNLTTSGSITITVDNAPPPDTLPPSVSLTAPAAGATISGTVTVSADAADNVGVAGVQFQLDGNPLGAEITGSGPYTFAWDTGTTTGGHSLTAVARDAAGNTATSGSITVSVDKGAPADTTLPGVTLTAPAAGATVSGTVTVSADAADNVGVAGVQFQLDGNPLGAEITGAGPYDFAWDTASAVPGGHNLTAVARDAAGNTATSGSIAVTVDNSPPPDSTLPSVTLTAPAAGAAVSGTVTVSADATDNVGVAGVQFQLDGNPLGAEITGAGPYDFAWDTASATSGSHSLTAVARDAAGNTATSTAVSVTVDSTAPVDGLTHQWKFDETSGATALDSAGTNSAILSNSLWVTGKTGNAASFNGTNALGDAGKIDFGTDSFTVAHWVNVNGFKNFAGIFNNRSSASGNAGFHTRTDGTGTITALIDFGATSKNLAVTNAVAGTWYHVAVSVDRAGLMKLYVNAVLSGQIDISAFNTASITNTDNVRLGRDQASNYFNGAIDDLRIYNRALSAADILQVYNE